MPLYYNLFELNEVENSEEYRLEMGWYRSGKTKVEVDLVNTYYSRILTETCPRYGYRSGHLHLYRNVRGTPDNCRACVLVLAAMQNVLTHEKRCWLLCTNIEFIMYPIYISVGTTLMPADVRRRLKYLRTICDNKCHLIRNRRDMFALLLIITSLRYFQWSLVMSKIAMSLLNATRLNTQLIRESS